ncbi:MAG: P44/Msp2 family outer membrane protein [Legionellales bacterium]|nr:P44/Msp2 family outer membrane protein [Legionellales bacterium]
MSKLNQCFIICFLCSLFFIESVQSTLALEGGLFRLNGGLMFPKKVSGIDYKSGAAGSASIGLKSGAVRYELEAKFMRSSISTPGGSVTFMSGIYNVAYDFEGLHVDLVPYISGGAGVTYANTTVSQTSTTGSSSTTTNVKKKQLTAGFQVKVGLNYVFTETFSWTLGYEYFRTLDIKNLANDNFVAHMLSLGAIWYIG